MSLEQPLCNYEDIITETRNDDIGNLPNIDHIINQSSRYVEEITDRKFWNYDNTAHAYIVNKDAIVSHILTLPFPVITLDRVVISGKEFSSADFYYELGRRSVYRLSDQAEAMDWSTKYPFFGKIEVYGTFGYTLDSSSPETEPPSNLPPDLRKAVTLIASAWTGEYEIERIGFEGDRETVLETHVPEEAKRLLKPYMPLKLDF